MKIKETLTITQTVNLLNGETVGIFPTMIEDTDPYSSLKYDLCLGYYMERSGDKPISPTFKRLYELKNLNPAIMQSAEEALGKIIRNKFKDKWSKQYNTLLVEQYNPLDDYVHDETISRDNSEVTTFDTKIENDGNRGSKIVTQFNDTDNDNIYGFNSSTAVPTDTSTSTSTETSTGSATDNTSHNTEDKTGTETHDYDDSETKNITGRRKIVAELIDKELDMRNRQIFFDIVYDDIDSIATIGVYTIPTDSYNPIKEYILSTLEINENGTYNASTYGADGFSRVVVGVQPSLQSKAVTENGTVVADEGYYGLRNVDVNVQPSLQSKIASQNGTYTPEEGYSGFSEFIVEIPYYDGTVVIE